MIIIGSVANVETTGSISNATGLYCEHNEPTSLQLTSLIVFNFSSCWDFRRPYALPPVRNKQPHTNIQMSNKPHG